MDLFLMVYCVADMQLIGLLGTHPKDSLYSQDEWVELKGILEIFYDNGRPFPYIQGEEIERIERLEVPYVYPSLYLPEDCVFVSTFRIKMSSIPCHIVAIIFTTLTE